MTTPAAVQTVGGHAARDAFAVTQLEAALAASDVRVTAPRRTILQLIADRGGSHFCAADLLVDAKRRRLEVGRATVFRTLDLLLAAGLIERIDLPDGDHAYVACQPRRHHHHIVCTGCGRSTDIADAELRAMIDAIGRATGYVIERHRLELYGRCPRCRTGASA
jgi:Fur family transcriptional regulator, ferric uptake regulator